MSVLADSGFWISTIPPRIKPLAAPLPTKSSKQHYNQSSSSHQFRKGSSSLLTQKRQRTLVRPFRHVLLHCDLYLGIPAFCGLLRWADVESHKAYMDRLRDGPRQGGALSGVNDMLTCPMELCHVRFTSLKNDWLGSVASERPDVICPNALFKHECHYEP